MSKHHKTIVPLVVPAARTFPRRFLFRIAYVYYYWKFKHPSRQQSAERTKSDDSFKKKKKFVVTKKERKSADDERNKYIAPLATRRPPARQPFLDVLEHVRVVWVREQIVHFGVRVFPKSEEFSPLLRGFIRHADYYE